MVDKPKTGSRIRVKTQHYDLFRPFAPNVQRVYEQIGMVIESADFDDPASFRLATGNPNFPESVVSLDQVIEIEYIDDTQKGIIHAQTSIKKEELEDIDTWSIKSSRGNESYTVTRKGNTWHCTCMGFQFRQSCKHIITKKEEYLKKT